MLILWISAGCLCLFYFLLLLIYNGLTSSFYLIWPLLSGGCFLMGWLFRIHFFARLHTGVRTALFLLFASGLLFFVSVEGMILKQAVQEPAEGLSHLIVLGAHVRSSGPSKSLAMRLDRAYEYAVQNPDTLVIVSGGQGSNEPCTEASVMQDYLLRKGLPAARILLEDRSANTRENLLFSKVLLPDDASVGIVSNGFHICRALHLAETLGYKNAAGVPAKSDLLTQPANLLREFFAVVKDFWLLC